MAQVLSGALTTGDAARALHLSQDRVMRLLNQGLLGGVRWGNRWFLTADDIEAFREQRYGAVQRLCWQALHADGVRLTPKQRSICEALKDGRSMTDASRVTGVPRPSLYAHLRLIKRKLDKHPTSPPQSRSKSQSSATG
ncbi:MAG: binding domain protein excisionase family [Chloroflexi bacterium]|nr:binding domain protein excisionase family [Chloroflexota bacterium]